MSELFFWLFGLEYPKRRPHIKKTFEPL